VAVQTKCFIFQFCLALTALYMLHHCANIRTFAKLHIEKL